MRTLIAVLLIMLTALAAPALAQDEPDASNAAESFSKGVELFEAKQYAEALPLLEEVVGSTNSPNARIYVARCLRELGRLAEAYEQMKLTVEEATTRAETDERYVPTRDSGAAELAILERKIGKLVLAIADPPPGTSIKLGERAIPLDQVGKAIAVAPGKATLSVTAPGKQPISRELDLAPGTLETVPLTLEDIPVAPDPVPVEPPKPPEPRPTELTGGELRIVGFIVGGLGVVGVAIGAGLAAKVDSDFDAIDQECGGTTCPTDLQSRVDDGRSLQTGANIALIGGAGLAVAGMAMIIFGGPTEAPVEGAALVPIPGGGLLQVGGRF